MVVCFPSLTRCLSCRGVNWNIKAMEIASAAASCLSCRGVNWNILSAGLFRPPIRVASHAEAWIEIKKACMASLVAGSLPLMQRRELKFIRFWLFVGKVLLPLMQRRELKWEFQINETWLRTVASHAEAWIEISVCASTNLASSGCLSCRGVNWNKKPDISKSSEPMLPLMQRRELKYARHPAPCRLSTGCLSCRGVNWNPWYLW